VEGYTGREAFLAEARRYAAGWSRLAEARRALEESPGDPRAWVLLGRLLLVRGEPEGVRLLEEAAVGASPEAAAESLYLLGRFYSRAAEQPARALAHWERLHREFREAEPAAGALYWLLKSYDESGRMEEGLEALEGGDLLLWAEDYEQAAAYLAEAGREEEAGEVARRGLGRFPEAEALREYSADDENA
jgi:tetratricopeptide (TPR) repeat protein